MVSSLRSCWNCFKTNFTIHLIIFFARMIHKKKYFNISLVWGYAIHIKSSMNWFLFCTKFFIDEFQCKHDSFDWWKSNDKFSRRDRTLFITYFMKHSMFSFCNNILYVKVAFPISKHFQTRPKMWFHGHSALFKFSNMNVKLRYIEKKTRRHKLVSSLLHLKCGLVNWCFFPTLVLSLWSEVTYVVMVDLIKMLGHLLCVTLKQLLVSAMRPHRHSKVSVRSRVLILAQWAENQLVTHRLFAWLLSSSRSWEYLSLGLPFGLLLG